MNEQDEELLERKVGDRCIYRLLTKCEVKFFF